MSDRKKKNISYTFLKKRIPVKVNVCMLKLSYRFKTFYKEVGYDIEGEATL